MNTDASLSSPSVSIILPVFNDEEWVSAALDSCLNQTLREIEVIVVDDASTDATVSVVERYQATDSRVHLIRQPENRTAFQARRVGIEAARAPYVLFLDGDDELFPQAAATALGVAELHRADVVGFGCEVVKPDGSVGGDYQDAMQPRHAELAEHAIIENLFPVGQTAQGQLWRYLFERRVLERAYGALPSSLALPRANDLPIAFLAMMNATHYVSTAAPLYRYFFRRGASGHRITEIAEYHFIASAIDSIYSIGDAVATYASERSAGATIRDAYQSSRLSVIARVLDYVLGIRDAQLQRVALDLLVERVSLEVLVAACVDFCPKALPLLLTVAPHPKLTDREPSHVLLRASNLGTGGAQGVVVSQAKFLAESGFKVTITVDFVPDTTFGLPPNVNLVQIEGLSPAQKVMQFVRLLGEQQVDVVIDHYVLYNNRWPHFALAAAAAGVPTIGWLHNFALRPFLDASTRLSYLDQYLPLLATVVVLSEADVAFWKLRGLPDVVYLPNPASPLLEIVSMDRPPRAAPSGQLELVWWGRLQQSTKQVRDLVHIGKALRDAGVKFRITIIGPDGPDLSASELRKLAAGLGIEDALNVRGPLHGEELIAAIEHAHVFVSTSVIEGYPLVFVEAQALGLPIVMYELPWLATLPGNTGIITVERGEPRSAARELTRFVEDAAAYERMSAGALDSARRALDHDFAELYGDLVRGRLGAEHSPSPSESNMRLLLDETIYIVERSFRREKRAIERARKESENQRARADLNERILRRARARFAADESVARARIVANESIVTDARAVAGASPSVARDGFKGWLQRIVPTTMRQAGFYARHQHKIAMQQYELVVKNQAVVNDHLARVAAEFEASQRALLNDMQRGFDRLAAATADLANVDDRIAKLEERLSSSGADSTQRILHGQKDLSSSVEAAHAELARVAAELSNEGSHASGDDLHALAQRIDGLQASTERSARGVGRVGRVADETLWATVFHDTVVDSEWFSDRRLSPGRWAVGYPFLYVLYRVLDEVAPKSVLEFGLGQSTKVVTQYSEFYADARHMVIEHDPTWVESFSSNAQLGSATRLEQLDLVRVDMPPHTGVLRYAGLDALLESDQFDLIIVDGPFGHGESLSRIDVLDVIRGALMSRFVILLDDAHRPGEQAAAEMIAQTLTECGIAHTTGTYRGQKDVWIAVSEDLAFLTTL